MTHSLNHPAGDASLAEWLTFLEALHSTEIELGLTRIRKVLQSMNLDLSSSTIITIAGTNGKGTTAAMLEASLLVQNKRVSVFSSPHIHRYNERLRIDGNDLPDADHIRAFEAVERCRDGVSLTYFEYSTLACLYLVAEANVDVALIEVGLGGRLDSTNVVDCDVAIVTTVDLDHQDWLGDNREAIGFEKAGIFRAGKPAIVGEIDCPASVLAYGKEIGAIVQQAGQSYCLEETGSSWNWKNEMQSYTDLPIVNVPLQNAATALAALSSCNLLPSREQLVEVCQHLTVPGRWQCIGQEPLVYLDVAHNPHAAKYLKKQLQTLPQQGKLRAVFAMMADKDIDSVLAVVEDQVDSWYLGQLDMPRAAKAADMASSLQKIGADQVSCFDNVEIAYKMAREASETEDKIIVFGSFFTVAAVLDCAH